MHSKTTHLPPVSAAARSAASGMLAIAACLLLGACPEIGIEPTRGPQGAVGMVVEVFGSNTNFVQGQTTAALTRSGGPSGIVVYQPVVVLSGTHARLKISIPVDEPTGPQTLTVSTGSEVAETTFEVTARPYIDSLVPAQGEQGDLGLVITVTGASTHFVQSAQWPEVEIPGVTVVSWNVIDHDHAEVGLDIALDAPVGLFPGAFQVYSDHQVLSADFEITTANRWITIAPGQVDQGQTETVTITGHKTAFLGAMDVQLDPPDGIDVLSVVPSSATVADVELRVHSYAGVGARTLTVVDPYGPLPAPLVVTEDLTPPGVTYDPFVAYPGEVVPVTALGVNTSFALPGTAVSWVPDDGSLTLTIDSVPGADRALLTATVSPSAAEQEYAVTLSTGGEHATGTFWVLPEPSLTIDPAAEHQDETVVIHVYGDSTHFDQTGTTVSFAASSGLSGSGWLVYDPEHATFTLHVAQDAPLGLIPGAITVTTPAFDETLSADFTVHKGRPVAQLTPPGVDQGSQGFVVQAEGRYTHWSQADTTVAVEPACQGFLAVHDVDVTSHTALSFQVDVATLAPLTTCVVEIVTDNGSIHEQVITQLIVLSGATPVVGTLPQTIAGYIDGPQLYSIDLNQGDVLRARASFNPVLYLDPTLAIYAPGATPTSTPLAENEDEHAATDDALIVYQAPESGTYYIVAQDRLGFEVGPFTLSLDHYRQSDPDEAEPNDDITSAEPLATRIVQGSIGAQGTPDFYAVQSSAMPPGSRVAVQVIAWSVSPYETSAADVLLRLYNAAQTEQDATSIGMESLDPVLYIDAGDLAYIGIENDTSGLVNTTYWINLRPQVVINEVHHDEANNWAAGFVELYGEPGMDLTGCHLLGKAYDTQPNQVFDIDLSGHVLLSSGYLVIAHDDLVPGTGAGYIDPNLVISDPATPYLSIGVVLSCNAAVVDAVCWRGSHLDECAGTFVPDDIDHLNIGRGFHVDTDDSAQDFLPQPEPSPWNRNLREVW